MGLFGRTKTPECSVAEAKQRMELGIMLLDIREDDEWARGRAVGARHLPMTQLNDRWDELGLNPGDDVSVICRSGGRSARITKALRQLGVEASNVSGGILAWQREGLPMEPADAHIS